MTVSVCDRLKILRKRKIREWLCNYILPTDRILDWENLLTYDRSSTYKETSKICALVRKFKKDVMFERDKARVYSQFYVRGMNYHRWTKFFDNFGWEEHICPEHGPTNVKHPEYSYVCELTGYNVADLRRFLGEAEGVLTSDALYCNVKPRGEFDRKTVNFHGMDPNVDHGLLTEALKNAGARSLISRPLTADIIVTAKTCILEDAEDRGQTTLTYGELIKKLTKYADT